MKARWAAATALVLLCTLAGCAMAERRAEGPDGIAGTADDGKSKAEVAAEMASTAATAFGYGWIGLVLQGLATAGSTAVTALTKR